MLPGSQSLHHCEWNRLIPTLITTAPRTNPRHYVQHFKKVLARYAWAKNTTFQAVLKGRQVTNHCEVKPAAWETARSRASTSGLFGVYSLWLTCQWEERCADKLAEVIFEIQLLGLLFTWNPHTAGQVTANHVKWPSFFLRVQATAETTCHLQIRNPTLCSTNVMRN